MICCIYGKLVIESFVSYTYRGIFLFTYLCSDFETSPEFEELWKQIEKQEIEKQTPSFSKSSIVPQKGATQASKVVVQDSTGPSVLKNLLSGTVKKEQTTTSPFNEKAENVKTTIIPLVPVLADNDHIKTELPFKRYSACTSSVSTPSYSPAHDENWPPTLTDSTTLAANAEDSILTTFR
ncbi:uncharacterized protein LOC128171031 isoform X1 [Crassostrea angulata]|nr:uncharacterized protein LOC128171031 isoform X1 [Crassostrea angulata]